MYDNQFTGDNILKTGLDAEFGIFVGKTCKFQGLHGNLLLYETDREGIFQTIFECLLLSVLTDAFYTCIHSIPVSVKDRYQKQIDDVLSVSVGVLPKPEKTTIEVGRSAGIHFDSDLPGYCVREDTLHYSYSEKGIIRCNGILVEGLKAGKTTLYIFKEGEQIPCASVDYTVILRNRITKIDLDASSICIGEGDSARLSYTYLPSDADNVSSVRWESDKPDIVSVDSHGNLFARKTGTCIVRIFAEQVSNRCSCVVKSHLKQIKTDISDLVMMYGQEQPLRLQLFPENCIDGEIVYSSMNMQIANVVSGVVKAVGMGTTRIIIQNREETVRTEIQVTVMAEKEFKKRKDEKEGADKKKKKNLLSMLLRH
ncbi:MAG: Ig-like domain-containing protein [Lachnospiraceae bacterium]|nr:Ig-like domain-containing protein [Lachnospiraceae bacterium]